VYTESVPPKQNTSTSGFWDVLFLDVYCMLSNYDVRGRPMTTAV